MIAAKVTEEAILAQSFVLPLRPNIGLEQYYSEAGPDYAADGERVQ